MAKSLKTINHKIVYIAGPMSMYESTIIDRFTSAENYIKNAIVNSVVLSPIRYPEGLHKNSYMDISFAYIRACTTLYMLKDWDKAQGSIAEYHYAVQIDKEIIFEI